MSDRLISHEQTRDDKRVDFVMQNVSIGGLRRLFKRAVRGLESAEPSNQAEGNSSKSEGNSSTEGKDADPS